MHKPIEKGSQITIELPTDCIQNNYFLGFALYSVYVPIDIESKEHVCSLNYGLTFHGHTFESLDNLSPEFGHRANSFLEIITRCCCCNNGDEWDPETHAQI